MPEYRCDQCGQRASADALPEQCDHCLNVGTMEPTARPEPAPLPQPRPEPSAPDSTPPPSAVELTYLTTRQSETIPFSGDVVVGREAAGAVILGNVAQVSRRHCRLRWDGGALVVQDMGSMHGTQVGPARANCQEPQVVSDGDTIYLGREPVRVRVAERARPPADPARPTEAAPVPPADPTPRVYHCVNCGAQSNAPIGFCDCGTMN